MSAPIRDRCGTRHVLGCMLYASALMMPVSAQELVAADAPRTGATSGVHRARAMHAVQPPPAVFAPPVGASDPAAYLAKLEAMPMTGMDMADDRRFGKVLINQLEWTHAGGLDGQVWEAQAWYGGDYNRLLLRSSGARSAGRLQDGDLDALWSHAIATFWDSTLGARHDFGAGPRRDWLAFGVQGIAPYWFDVEATGYVGPGGRTAARLKLEYELLFTQRLILQSEFETNLYGRRDPMRGLGSGLSDASLGLRLRYEIRREFAPYIGVVWQRMFGGTADLRRAQGHPVFERQFVAGVHAWF